jgi:hypothetical protein
MKLARLCKSAESWGKSDCPAVYVTEDPRHLVTQGVNLDAGTAAELISLGENESGVALPTETVARAVGLLLARHGHPEVSESVERFLAEQGWADR